MGVCGVSVDTTILHTFLSTPACIDIVYSKELERDLATSAMAKTILRLKTLVFMWVPCYKIGEDGHVQIPYFASNKLFRN